VAPQPPPIEPDRATPGTTWTWEIALRDFPATDYTLKYRFAASATALFSVTSAANGSAHRVTIAAATTAGYSAGKYAWVSWAEDGSGNKYEQGRGVLEVLPGLASGDPRSHARKALDAIEAVLENRATQDQMSYEISVGGSLRRLGRTPLPELTALREYYRAEVARENRSDKLRRGVPSRTRVLTAFTRPR
jgi:hypothetical protein